MQLKPSTGKPTQVALLSGHTILVPPEGREVPKLYQQEAFRCGCVPVETPLDNEPEPTTELKGEEKTLAIAEAMKEMLDEGCSLTGSGLPNLNQLMAKSGMKITKEEAHTAWKLLEAE